ncbi:30S ribosomal protein S9 [bacterium]|nr:30S ribosomal protein S9 [bacterium]
MKKGAVKYYATGKRKTSVARVWISSGKGQIIVNGRKLADYVQRDDLQTDVLSPLAITESLNKIDVHATVKGGGITGQAGAIRHGLARALVVYNESFKPTLKSADMLTRDSRMKERKKCGRPGARKRFQFSKR